ncbi:MAG: phasin family protein [Litorimonas sp.]
MSDDDQTPESSDRKTGDVARRIWLAGIGAYGRAFEEGRDMVKGLGAKVPGAGSDMFDTLAAKGEQLEMAAKVKGAQLAGKASELTDDIRSTVGIEDRISAMRTRLSGGSDDRLDAVEDRLARIEAKLDTLIAAPAKAASPKRATTTRTKKAPAKKAAPKGTKTQSTKKSS